MASYGGDEGGEHSHGDEARGAGDEHEGSGGDGGHFGSGLAQARKMGRVCVCERWKEVKSENGVREHVNRVMTPQPRTLPAEDAEADISGDPARASSQPLRFPDTPHAQLSRRPLPLIATSMSPRRRH
jgi:hypothetical protein